MMPRIRGIGMEQTGGMEMRSKLDSDAGAHYRCTLRALMQSNGQPASAYDRHVWHITNLTPQ